MIFKNMIIQLLFFKIVIRILSMDKRFIFLQSYLINVLYLKSTLAYLSFVTGFFSQKLSYLLIIAICPLIFFESQLINIDCIYLIPLPLAMTEQQARILYYNKVIIYKFCHHFENNSLETLLDDKSFYQIISKMMHQEYSLISRPFQIGFETGYNKRKFGEASFQEFSKDHCIIRDNFYGNRGLIDQSTVYSGMLTKKVVYNLSLCRTDVVVNATPLYLNLNEITIEQRKWIDICKKLTGNSVPDLCIKDRPYDYKFRAEDDFSKNIILFIDSSRFITEGAKLIFKMQQSLQGSINNPLTDKHARLYYKELLKVIDNGTQIRSSAQTIVEDLNRFIIKQEPPIMVSFPLVISHNYPKISHLINTEDHSAVAKVCLEKGHLTDVKVRKAIIGIVDNYGPTTQEVVAQATKNSLLPHIKQVKPSEDVD